MPARVTRVLAVGVHRFAADLQHLADEHLRAYVELASTAAEAEELLAYRSYDALLLTTPESYSARLLELARSKGSLVIGLTSGAAGTGDLQPDITVLSEPRALMIQNVLGVLALDRD